jgi:hypothetical protein
VEAKINFHFTIRRLYTLEGWVDLRIGLYLLALRYLKSYLEERLSDGERRVV